MWVGGNQGAVKQNQPVQTRYRLEEWEILWRLWTVVDLFSTSVLTTSTACRPCKWHIQRDNNTPPTSTQQSSQLLMTEVKLELVMVHLKSKHSQRRGKKTAGSSLRGLDVYSCEGLRGMEGGGVGWCALPSSAFRVWLLQ